MGAVAVVPAAGSGIRFGGAKLLATMKGAPLLDWTLWSLLDGGMERVIVVAAPGADFSAARFMADPRVKLVENPQPDRGMFSSIQAGVAAANGDPILILPGDMPFVSSGTVTSVTVACIRQQRVVVPTFNQRRGHPIAVPASFQLAILESPADATLKDAIAATGEWRVELPVDDPGILRDVDTPADLDPQA